ncbi:MAG: hypothetical protein ABIC04_04055 [Nanoarchaeota archaeon]
MKTTMKRIAIILLVAAILIPITLANPYGPTSIENVTTSRTNITGDPQALGAQAGNVTQLTINTTIVTKRWQGYYGNISGKVVLGDASGNTMFDWTGGSSFSPVGEIYAANNTVVDWGNVNCVNFSGNGSIGTQGINHTTLESMYGMASSDSDGIDETFRGYSNITIGTRELLNCRSTNTYDNNGAQTSYFNETILTEYNQNTVIYATEVSQNTVGFDGNIWDFQMLVADNGDDDASTVYYFYVELT